MPLLGEKKMSIAKNNDLTQFKLPEDGQQE